MKLKVFYTDPQNPYMIRIELLSLLGWSLKLHVFLRDDPDPEFHDHPWDFWSRVMDGYYTELTGKDVVYRGTGNLAFRKAEHRHRVLVESPCLTLILTKPKRREWGFWRKISSSDHRFIPWRQFVAERGREKR